MPHLHHIPGRTKHRPPLRVGIGGPVGSGKTTLLEMLCKDMRARWDLVAITNDIYTIEDAKILSRNSVLPLDRIVGLETGGCPHTAIREDASINLAAVAEMRRRFPALDLVLLELRNQRDAALTRPDQQEAFANFHQMERCRRARPCQRQAHRLANPD